MKNMVLVLKLSVLVLILSGFAAATYAQCANGVCKPKFKKAPIKRFIRR